MSSFEMLLNLLLKEKKMLLNLLPRAFGQFRLKSMTLIMRKIKKYIYKKSIKIIKAREIPKTYDHDNDSHKMMIMII